ncbi:hypothetical protein SRRS_50350 [Sporomusa rhizae]|uniref:hypothetical protein n=1 Tax=Sporomusa rhizae TaxID=357999 RepID=UPI003529D668
MLVVGSGIASYWFSDNMEEQVVASNGEFILLNANTRKAERLGTTLEEAVEALKVLGKFGDFPDF